MSDSEMVRAQLRFEMKKAFVLDSTSLKKIWRALEGENGKVSATMECKDGAIYKDCNLNYILEYENSPRSVISSINISSYDQKKKYTNYVYIGESRTGPLSLSLEGDVSEMSTMRSKLIDVFEGMKPWYDVIARFEFAYLVFAFFGLLAVYGSLVPSTRPKEELPPIEILYNLGLISAVIIGMFLGGLMIANIRNKLFPVSFFAIGQGSKRYEVAEKVRWGVCVSLAVGILGSLLFKPFA